MPLTIRGTVYPIPFDEGVKGATGGELAAIEDAFSIRDGLLLLRTLGMSDEEIGELPPGYARWKAAHALCWLALHRQDPAVTLLSVMDEYGIDEFDLTGVPDPQEPDDASTQASEG